MEEVNLFNYKAYQKKSNTSKNAYYQKKNKNTLRDEVYELLLLKDYSNEQIANELNIPLSSACARCRELQISDKVIDSGMKTLTKFGRKAVLWGAKQRLKPKDCT